MYGATREHAPRSTQIAGAFTALTATLAFGYAMANGLGEYIAKSIPDPIIYVPLPDEQQVETPPPDATSLATDTATLVVPPPIYVPQVFVPEDIGIKTTGEGEALVGPLVPPKPPIPPATPVRLSPKMLAAPLPAYPPGPLRMNVEGITALALCIDPRGTVTSATLAKSSGNTALDDAALRWVRRQTFTPAKVDGQPQAICGHPITYEWRITHH